MFQIEKDPHKYGDRKWEWEAGRVGSNITVHGRFSVRRGGAPLEILAAPLLAADWLTPAERGWQLRLTDVTCAAGTKISQPHGRLYITRLWLNHAFGRDRHERLNFLGRKIVPLKCFELRQIPSQGRESKIWRDFTPHLFVSPLQDYELLFRSGKLIFVVYCFFLLLLLGNQSLCVIGRLPCQPVSLN